MKILLLSFICLVSSIVHPNWSQCQSNRDNISDVPSACALLTEETIRTYFKIPIEINIINTTRESATFGSCRYTWQSDTVKEVTVAGRSFKVKAENKVMLTISEIGDLEPELAYKQSVAPLKNNPHHDIKDLGKRAIWVSSLNQLSVLAKDNILHVVVENYEVENNEDQATEFTRMLIQKL